MKLQQPGSNLPLTLTCSNCGETCGIQIIAGWGTDEEEYLSDCCEELILGNGIPITQIELRHYFGEQRSWEGPSR